MERKMMLTIKKLSERTANTSRPVAAHCRVGLTGE
jgi:hypothetical protein